jgi:hypothetical protein
MSVGKEVLNKIYNDLFLGLDEQKQQNVLDCLVSLKEIIKSKKKYKIKTSLFSIKKLKSLENYTLFK